MADNNPNINKTNSFDQGLNVDVKDYHSNPRQYSYARNSSFFSPTGDLGSIGNEIANKLSALVPYTVIGFIHLYSDIWAVFSTNDTDSEIGRFVESTSTYTTVVNDSYYTAGFKRFNFNRANLITGQAKENFDCSWWIYWADGNNPDRAMNFDLPALLQNCTIVNSCQVCTPVLIAGKTVVDMDAIRLAKLVTMPCLRVVKGASGGNLPNGSYFVVPAYLINGQKVTDYFAPSNVQALFEHSNVAGSIDVIIDSMDERFDQFELVVVSIVNGQTQAKKFGIYNTRQKQITIDIIDNKLVDVPIEQIPIQNPIAEKSDAMYTVGNYLLRVGPTNKFDFNYQPLANQIVVKWQSVEYPADYYRKGGTNVGRLRDENYCEFIQWIYDDGDVSSAYHIPGRPAVVFPLTGTLENAALGGSADSIDPTDKVFDVYNTAQLSGPTTAIPTADGGFIIQEGYMGYWESTEAYPDNKSDVYNASTYGPFVPPYAGTGVADYDLCGKPVRHHKMPEQRLSPNLVHFTGSSPNFNGQPAIRIIATKYENIKPPVDNNGVLIPGIIGYRILRGGREGNKTIVAKGMFNNMWEYFIEGTTAKRGLYPNYPYNDIRSVNQFPFGGGDVYISQMDTSEFNGQVNSIPNQNVTFDKYTFHSPDTQFREPFLSMKEVKLYGELRGTVLGNFVEPDKHPKHKFVTDAAFFMAAIAGVGIAILSMNGKRTTTHLMPRKTDFIDSGNFGGPAGVGVSGLADPITIAAMPIALANDASLIAVLGGSNAAFWAAGGQLAGNVAGQSSSSPVGYYGAIATSGLLAQNVPGMSGYMTNIEQESGAYDNTPTILTALQLVPSLAYYWGQGTDATLALINAMIKWEQHALQYQSHCLYDGWGNSVIGNTRRLIQDEIYLDNQLQDFGTTHRINNLFRGKAVAVQTAITFGPPTAVDNTRQTVGTAMSLGLGPTYKEPLTAFETTSVCHYGALKNRIKNQYGQIGGVQQIPLNSCPITVTGATFPVSTSEPLFGGDTYVTRYTEKNTMFFFYDWLYGQPDGYEFNYHLKKYIPYPAYWMDTQKWDVSDFVGGLTGALTGGGWQNLLPSSLHAFDRQGLVNGGMFGIHNAYIYLFNSGVRDFYVESDVNTDLRDWGDNQNQRYYDPYRYTDEKLLFNADPDIIKAGNYFKYDYSLSVSKLFTQFISWANIQPINYDPAIYESCYVHNPNLVIYSLPSTDVTSQQSQLIKDNWLVYLANNYKYFQTPVTAIESINKSGAVFFFGTQSPQQMVGVDTLRLGSNTDVTVGTGALFSQPLQNLITANSVFETGSCQNRLSVANTPAGMFWISQSTGKIFNGTQVISGEAMEWWFSQYLPYQLTKLFPTFELQDNPVIGIGCQTIYDQQNTVVYFMKRDFVLKDGFIPAPFGPAVPNGVAYTGVDNFLVGGILPIKLGDPRYFDDASWCISYNPSGKYWISYHDWKAELCMPGKNTFLTTKTNSSGQGGLWVHNSRCDLYCNYFGVDYPFEVEYRVVTGQQTTVTGSVEHQAEVYIYDPNNCHDRYQELSAYFDRAIVYNQEQVSGYLNLIPTDVNDPWQALGYPKINPNSIDILYDKVEGKYRFNAFFDITDNRGQFSNAKRMIFNTEPNGYIKTLNPLNLNYNKDELQKKRFRSYNNSVWLQKKVCGNKLILLLLVNNKLINSPR